MPAGEKRKVAEETRKKITALGIGMKRITALGIEMKKTTALGIEIMSGGVGVDVKGIINTGMGTGGDKMMIMTTMMMLGIGSINHSAMTLRMRVR